MKKFKYLLIIFSAILFFTACETTEIGETDCITCQNIQTEYCFTEGYAYYIITTVDGTETVGELIGSWEDTKLILTAQCNNTDPTPNCYTCTDTSTEYCYTPGNGYYTITIGSDSPTQESLNNTSWADLRAGFVSDCGGSNQEDYNFIGTWKLTDFTVESTNTITYNDDTVPQITSVTNQNYVSGDSFLTFESSTYDTSGSILIRSITTANGIETDNFEYSSESTGAGTWTVVGDQMNLFDADTSVPTTGTIIEYSNTVFKLKYINHVSTDNAAGNSTTDILSIQTFTKQ